MNFTRRAFGARLIAGLSAASGCLGFVRGDDSLAFEAVGARPSDEALARTGYRHARTEVEQLSETIEIAGKSREVELENVVVECDKGVDLWVLGTLRAATFVAFSTPKFEVLGRSFHPGERVSPRRIATEFGSNYDEFSMGEEVEEWELTVFGEEVDVSTFEGRAAMDRVDLDVHVHIGVAANDDDFVVFVGAHPRDLDGERSSIARLVESLAPIE